LSDIFTTLVIPESDIPYPCQLHDAEIEELMQDTSVIRHRAKIKAAISNAKVFIEQQEFSSCCHYLYSCVDNKTFVNEFDTTEDYVATSPLSDAISEDLKNVVLNFFTQRYASLWSN
jgi:DNA-3-methyladenine glycosylase I